MARSGPVTKDTSTVALGLAQIRIGDSVSNIATIAPVLASTDSIGALASTKFMGNVDYWKLESGFPLQEDLTIPLRETNALECAFKEITPYNLAMARGINPLDDISATVTEITSVTTSGTTTGEITVTDAGGVETDTWTVVFTTATTGEIYGALTGHIHTFSDLTTIMAPDNGGEPYFSVPANFFSGTWAADETYVFQTTAFVSGTAAYGSAHTGSINLGTVSAPKFLRMEAVYTFPNGINTMTIVFPRANVVSSVEMDLQAEDAAAVTINLESKSSGQDVSGGNAVWDSMPLGRIVFA